MLCVYDINKFMIIVIISICYSDCFMSVCYNYVFDVLYVFYLVYVMYYVYCIDCVLFVLFVV